MRRFAVVVLLVGIAVTGGIRAEEEVGVAADAKLFAGAFQPLPPGAVEPQGWLRDWAVSMREGMTGHLDEYDPVFQFGWLGQRLGTTGESAPGEGWPLEQSAYWIDGAVRLGHVLHDDALLARVLPRLEKIAEAGRDNDSYLWWREKFSWDGRNGPPVEGFNLWSCAVLGRALIAQYEATGDRKWLACIERFFDTMPADALFPISRSTVNLETLHEAGRLGADAGIWNGVLDAARRLRREDDAWSREKYWSAMKPKDAEHGVTFNELAKLPLLLLAGTGDESFRRATLDRYHTLYEKHQLPYGVNSASERLAGIGALQATESCNVSDLIWSHLWMLRLLGDPLDGDRIETAFFNAAPACVSRDCRRHVYYQSPNRPVPKPGPKGPGHPTNADFAKTQKPLCCTGNIPRIVPNYIIHMWMTTPDHGLAATLYGPCTARAKVADGVEVTLAATTDYPFGEEIVVTVTPAKPVRCPLYFRIPGWCENPSFEVNGAALEAAERTNGFLRIERTWSAGDTVAIRFPMPPRVVKGRESGGAPYACVHAGPLLFARAVPEKSENESSGEGWHYALDFESDRATAGMTIKRTPMPARWDWPHAAPVLLTVPAQGIDWKSDKGAEGGLPAGPVEGRGDKMIDLIPYGCAKFRISMFPVTAKAWGSGK
ncbi:MAG: glycoside hydrolase family 127 protein [Verrucomicrobia bacterium]|nr:glycoside hydrolase family 127 protein [Verrucomicrobiota bacterium]MDA1004862.1 glycoside hydrolase family 127 protein [Verrucomicrobiota bacterium]